MRHGSGVIQYLGRSMNMFKKYLIWISLFLVFTQGCNYTRISDPESGTGNIVILYTNDEHGWMASTDEKDGAAGLAGLWKEQENYDPDGHFLILSGGDMWTGPALSTWFQGEPMVEVMNALNYDAAAIGNHEFDFKIDGLKARIAEANFPLIAANIREKATGNIPDFAKPYILKKVNGVMVGIIGLSNVGTPLTTFPKNVADYNFISYETALDEIVPQVKKDGAELLIVVGHICSWEMRALVPKAKELGISILTGGHCHELVTELVDGVALIESGSYMKNYVRLEIAYDLEQDKITRLVPTLHANENSNPDTQVAAIVAKWQNKLNASLSQVIGYADESIDQHSNAMNNMVTDSWLVNFPLADVSITNTGGIRQSIPAGDISLETMVGLLPFDNTLFQLEMPGEDLINVLTNSGDENLVFGGMTMTDGYKLSDGKLIHEDSVYLVLTTDYLYSRPDYSFQIVDPEPYSTSVHYRQPLIDWIESLHTTSAQPLNNFLDDAPRK